jgi:glc operon protein GlcG
MAAQHEKVNGMRTRFALGLSEVETAVRAGCVEAQNQGWTVTIAVVGDPGTLIQLSRMDEASPASVTTATEKARSAALTGIETKILEALVKDRPALVTMGRVSIEGGVPIFYQGQKVGGIGVSGVQSQQDAQIANAALAALITALDA